MAGLLPSKVVTALDHLFYDISVTHFCSQEGDAFLFEIFFKTQVAHDSCHNSVVFQHTATLQLCRPHANGLVSVNHPALFIAQNGPVSIPVVSYTRVCLVQSNSLLKSFNMQGTRILVNVLAVRLVVNRDKKELAKGTKAFTPAGRNRKISKALKVYSMLASSADKGAVRVLPEEIK